MTPDVQPESITTKRTERQVFIRVSLRRTTSLFLGVPSMGDNAYQYILNRRKHLDTDDMLAIGGRVERGRNEETRKI